VNYANNEGARAQGMEASPRTPQVDEAVGRMDATVSRVRSAIESLATRLGPCLSPAPPSTAQADGKLMGVGNPRCDLANTIHAIAAALEASEDILLSIRNRLEV